MEYAEVLEPGHLIKQEVAISIFRERMYLYSLTVKQPTSISKAITGSFSSAKANELLVARSRLLELYRQEETTGRRDLTRKPCKADIARCVRDN